MPSPYDFTVKTTTPYDPFGSLQQGFALGQGIAEAKAFDVEQQQKAVLGQQKQAALVAQQAAAQAQAQRDAQMRTELETLSKNPTTTGIAAITVKYPQLAEQFKTTYSNLAEAEQKSYLDTATRAYAAVNAGQGEMAVTALREAAAAHANTPGMEKQAEALNNIADLAEKSPAAAKSSLGLFLSGAMGPKEFAGTFEKLENMEAIKAKNEAEAAKSETEASFAAAQELKKLEYTDAQIARLFAQTKNEADRLGFDRWKAQKEFALAKDRLKADTRSLPPAIAKSVDDNILKSVGATEAANKTRVVGNKLRELGKKNPVYQFLNTGLNGRAGEWIADTFGLSDDVNSLRKRYKAIVNKQVLEDLPPGAASDVDVALAREAFENPYSDFNTLANGLDAFARIQDAVARNAQTQAQWQLQNGGYGDAVAPTVIRTDQYPDGLVVPAGTSFAQAKQLIDQADSDAQAKSEVRKYGGESGADGVLLRKGSTTSKFPSNRQSQMESLGWETVSEEDAQVEADSIMGVGDD